MATMRTNMRLAVGTPVVVDAAKGRSMERWNGRRGKVVGHFRDCADMVVVFIEAVEDGPGLWHPADGHARHLTAWNGEVEEVRP